MDGIINKDYIGVELTWEEIKKHFPNTFVGLDVIEYKDKSECNIKLAKVLCTSNDPDELIIKQSKGEINDSRGTMSVGIQLGIVGLL